MDYSKKFVKELKVYSNDELHKHIKGNKSNINSKTGYISSGHNIGFNNRNNNNNNISNNNNNANESGNNVLNVVREEEGSFFIYLLLFIIINYFII